MGDCGNTSIRRSLWLYVTQGDTQFKSLIDETIANAQKSGAAEKSFNRWFNAPIPPKNLNLKFTISDEMKALFASPNDKALN